MKIAIFDLDGTVNTSHKRKHLIPARSQVSNAAWAEWHEAFELEDLCMPVIKQAAELYASGYTIFVVSNRSDYLADATDKVLMAAGFPPAHYVLRSKDDHRHPLVWKTNTVAVLLATMQSGRVMFYDDDANAIHEVAGALEKRTDIIYNGVVVQIEQEKEVAPENYKPSNHTIIEVRY